MKINEVIQDMGLIRVLIIVFLVIGAFVDNWKGICRPIIMLIFIRYIPPMLTAWGTKKATNDQNGISSEFTSIVIAALVMFVVAVIIFFGLKDL